LGAAGRKKPASGKQVVVIVPPANENGCVSEVVGAARRELPTIPPLAPSQGFPQSSPQARAKRVRL
jgi:hypothetical protein